MKIYIAGKIAGDKRYKTKFREVEQRLTNAGHIALNPALQPAGLTPADYMRVCFAMMDSADAVLFLPDYQDSPGARLEMEWCKYTGKAVVFDLSMFGGAQV